jgi:signal transduction histidine kinase
VAHRVVDQIAQGSGDRRRVAAHDEREPWLEVADQGPGVPAADRARIFEPFWRGGRMPGAAGIGLSIVREMAELHGGSVSLHDNPPHGSIFRIHFATGARRGRGRERHAAASEPVGAEMT